MSYMNIGYPSSILYSIFKNRNLLDERDMLMYGLLDHWISLLMIFHQHLKWTKWNTQVGGKLFWVWEFGRSNLGLLAIFILSVFSIARQTLFYKTMQSDHMWFSYIGSLCFSPPIPGLQVFSTATSDRPGPSRVGKCAPSTLWYRYSPRIHSSFTYAWAHEW